MSINKKVYTIIILSFLLSLITSFLFIKNFDSYEISTDNIQNHAMIKGDIPSIWIDGQIIKNDLNNGKGYFESGKEIFRSYLPPRTIALFSYIFNYDLFENWENKIFSSDNKKMYYLFLQSFFYFASLIILFREIKQHYKLDACLFIVLFLRLSLQFFFITLHFIQSQFFYNANTYVNDVIK